MTTVYGERQLSIKWEGAYKTFLWVGISNGDFITLLIGLQLLKNACKCWQNKKQKQNNVHKESKNTARIRIANSCPIYYFTSLNKEKYFSKDKQKKISWILIKIEKKTVE